jgi:hypothetical protein
VVVLRSNTPPAAEARASRLAFRLSLATVLAALLPIAVATARAINRDWIPVGDHAFFVIRARDVLTGHHPLLGTGSSGSLSAGTDLNHPGPLLFDWLALPVRLFGSGAGLALGIALLNGLAVIGIAVVAYRRGGPLLATAATAIAAGLCWAMGSELLFEPWQPHSLLLPFLCFLMLVWSLACGDLVVLPWAAGVGSFILQTHLSYGLLVPVLGAWAVLGLVVALDRQRRRDPRSWPGLRRRALRAAAVAGLVLVACWAQPLVEQFTSDGPGNLTRLARIRDPAFGTIGYGRGARILATVVSVPPWWLRPSFSNAIKGWQVPSPGLAAASLSLLTVVLAGCAWDARRRGDREAFHAVATAAVVLVGGLATAGRVPFGNFGIPAGQYRWLWPLAAFVSFAVVATLVRRLARRPVRSAVLVGAFAVTTVVIAALNLPTSDQGTAAQPESFPAVRELGRQMAGLEDEGTLLVRVSASFESPYGTAVMAELQRRGVPFVVDDATLVRQLGPDRRFTGSNARALLFVVTGDATGVAPRGARRVAVVQGLSAQEQLELSRLEKRIEEYVADGRVRVNRRGGAALERLVTARGGSSGQGGDPERALTPREVAGLGQAGFLVAADGWGRRFERYADLHDRRDDDTVALFLEPLGDRTSPAR